ncbi:hypothetical protein DFH11DRAFT_1725842 [Phellopilus nigrolimitatus]|nr:hypothetical protein DFH11DRAFT_1725842 [Phellopilus nigrolimitatus]
MEGLSEKLEFLISYISFRIDGRLAVQHSELDEFVMRTGDVTFSTDSTTPIRKRLLYFLKTMPCLPICALLIDLSGSLHVGPTRRPPRPPLPRARQAGLVVRFCSNASQEGTRALRERLGGMGFDLRDGEL